MANNDCLPQVQACRIRVANLEPNGVPDPGADNLYTSDALVELTATPVYEDGTNIRQKNACGTVCLDYSGDDSFVRYDIALTICTQDPRLMSMLGGGDVITDVVNGETVRGYAGPAIGALSGNGVSLELWAVRVDDGQKHAEFPYAWHVYPKVTNLREGVRTFSDGSQLPQFTGRAFENPNWFDGPTNDWPAASDRAHQWFPTAVLPTATCGPVALAVS